MNNWTTFIQTNRNTKKQINIVKLHKYLENTQVQVCPIVVKLFDKIQRENELGEQIEKKARKRKNRIERKREKEI